MKTQSNGCALRSFDDPARIVEDAEDVGSFDFFQGIGSQRLRHRVRMERCVIDLKHRSFCEDRGPFNYIFQLSNIAGPAIFGKAIHGRVGHPVKLLTQFL